MITAIRNWFLKIFGDIKVFPWPLFFLYDPCSYKVKASDMREIMDKVCPGDILVRGYKNYLDGHFIPGLFSHVGLYLGKVEEKDLPDIVQKRESEREKAGKKKKLYTGEYLVIHSMAEGVFTEDILKFCQCDFFVILRRKKETEGEEIPPLTKDDKVYKKALEQLGKGYDFGFDFLRGGELSCTELVYNCCKEFLSLYNVKLKKTKFIYFFKRDAVLPNAFITEQFEIVFRSESVPKGEIDRILKLNKE